MKNIFYLWLHFFRYRNHELLYGLRQQPLQGVSVCLTLTRLFISRCSTTNNDIVNFQRSLKRDAAVPVFYSVHVVLMTYHTLYRHNSLFYTRDVAVYYLCVVLKMKIEPSHQKTNILGFRPGLTQTGLYSHRSRLEA